MRDANIANQNSWKQFFQDALFEMEPRAFLAKLETARKAVEGRLVELGSNGNASECELVELKYAQYAISVLRRS